MQARCLDVRMFQHYVQTRYELKGLSVALSHGLAQMRKTVRSRQCTIETQYRNMPLFVRSNDLPACGNSSEVLPDYFHTPTHLGKVIDHQGVTRQNVSTSCIRDIVVDPGCSI